MRLSLIQMNSKVGDIESNVAHADALIDEAAGSNPDLIVLPEFWSTGYFPLSIDYSFYDLAAVEDGLAMTSMKEKAREHDVHIVSTIYERAGAGLFYNTSMIVNPQGEIILKYRKVHVPARRGLEKLFYRRGSKYPIAEVNGWRVGVVLCYDSLFPEPTRILALKGAELIVVPFGASTTEHSIWDQVMVTRAFENSCFVAPCNAIGDLSMPDGSPFNLGGKSLIASPKGRIIAEGGATGEEIVNGELDLAEVEDVRRKYFMFRDRRPDSYGVLTMASEDVHAQAD